MKRIYLFIVLLLCGSQALSAQESYRGYPTQEGFAPQTESTQDLRMRISADVEKKLGRNWTLALNEELRLKDNLREVDRLNTQFSVAYRVNPYFKVAAGYVLMALHKQNSVEGADGVVRTEGEWQVRHRFQLDLTGTYRTGRWNFSLRERLQATIRTDSVDAREKLENEWCLRHRLRAQYAFPHKPWKPYAYVELRHTLNVQEIVGDNFINRMRASVGAEYLINSRHSFDFYYLFDYSKGYDIGFTRNKGLLKEYTTEKGYYHTLGVQYNFSF